MMFKLFFPQNRVATLGVLTVSVQDPRGRVRLFAIYSAFMPLKIVDGALVAFLHMVVTSVAGARDTSCFRGPKSTFPDRRKGSERFYFEMQISRQVQHFGHGGDR